MALSELFRVLTWVYGYGLTTYTHGLELPLYDLAVEVFNGIHGNVERFLVHLRSDDVLE